MNPNQFPQEFVDRLANIVPASLLNQVASSFDDESLIIFRVNTLKTSISDVVKELEGQGVPYNTFTIMPEALKVGLEGLALFDQNGFIEKGFVYRQSLSSMLAVGALDPRPGEHVLDLCAAPGSKASQIAARMNNQGTLTAVEPVRGRFYKLKSVLNLLGVTNASCVCLDGRRFRSRGELFDRILVDAPCSSEGRFKRNNAKSYQYWSLRKVKEMVQKQRGILLNAGRLLKNNGVLIYSTCTFAPEENEGVVNWFLKKTGGEFIIEEHSFGDEIKQYPAVLSWGKKVFNPQVEQCCRILPAGAAEGFFITKFRKS